MSVKGRTTMGAGIALLFLSATPAVMAQQTSAPPPAKKVTTLSRPLKSTVVYTPTVLQQTTAAYLGIEFRCERCDVSFGDSVTAFRFSEPPVVAAVAKGGPADKAGIQVGDTVTRIDGVSIVSSAGAQRLASLERGIAVKITVSRGSAAGGSREVTLVPSSPPATYHKGAAAGALLSGKSVWTRQSDSATFKGFLLADSAGWTSRAHGLPRKDTVAYSTFTVLPHTPHLLTSRSFTLSNRAPSVRNADSTAAKTDSTAKFTGTFSGLSVTVSGDKPVTVSIVEPDCILAIDVEGSHILLKSPKCMQ
jgi:membrane-associated protease RseP (regulator of RpoE activity)